ncbi:MAG: tRNA (N6-isopentenyl adenosine(37)-C2)-methylthiotransferase MiaB [Parcubacteria group bacterium]|nr:tRNA (N6-isopentenyl adenosine(37)-C2)-methylthiotransferase MiaB [Parcubacteria group bacterium]
MPKKVHLFTLGCQQNKSDSERVASVFTSMRYQQTEREADASVIVVNACAIRQTAMDRIYGKLQHWKPRQQKGELTTILTGCVLQYDREKLSKSFDHVVSITDIGKIPELLGEGEALNLADYFSVPPTHTNDFKAYVPIMTGCDKFCTYCAVPYTRGREISRPANDILDEVKHLLARGYKEITLLGQNVNSYAGLYDKPVEKRGLLVLNRKKAAANDAPVQFVNFPQLLEMIAVLPGDFWVRFVTSHPYDMSDELIETIAKYDKLANYINLPVQAGDGDILKKMNRHYTVEHYLGRVKKIRELLNPVSITTDIIIGFCGETEAQFQRTAEVMREVEYDMGYLNKYSPRPGTVSARKYPDDVPLPEKQRREKMLNDILKKTGLKQNRKFIGQTVRVLVDTAETVDGGLLMNMGKTALFKNTQFVSARSYVGHFVDVKITAVEPFGMSGELV